MIDGVGRVARANVWAMVLCLSVVQGCSTQATRAPAARLPVSDAACREAILAAWTSDHPGAAVVPDVSVSDGVVILTGTLPDPKWRVDAVREAWQQGTVREVVDELQVSLGDSTYAADTSLTIRLRARLTFDPLIQSTNYSIETVGGVIYLMGIAQTRDELDKVKRLAGEIGTGKVVSFVRVKPSSTDEPRKS